MIKYTNKDKVMTMDFDDKRLSAIHKLPQPLRRLHSPLHKFNFEVIKYYKQR